MAKEAVKDFYGKILGWLEDKGDRIEARNFNGVQLGTYYKNRNVTTDFIGRQICTGDGTVGLIMKDSNS